MRDEKDKAKRTYLKKITKPTTEDKEMENNLKEPTKIKKKVGRQRVKDVIKK